MFISSLSQQIVIAVDFDGTIFEESEDGLVPIAGAKDKLEKLRALGCHIVIHTCRTTEASERDSLMEEVEHIARSLEAFGIPYDEIYLGKKMIADIYVDDRAVGFRGDWDQTEIEIIEKIDKLVKDIA